MVEIVLLLLVVGCGVSLLLPSLVVSREHARSNLCGRNLRRLDLAMADYISSKNPRQLPASASWPVTLLPRLQDYAGVERQSLGQDIFRIPRPILLTCPSHMYIRRGAAPDQRAHYELIVDRTLPRDEQITSWRFRDRAIDVDDGGQTMWYSGDELTPAAAAVQLQTASGPHVEGQFMESDSRGASRIAR